MALVTSPLLNLKPLQFSPLRRTTRCLHASFAAARGLDLRHRHNAKPNNGLPYVGKNVSVAALQNRNGRISRAAMAEAAEPGRRILMSEVVVKRPTKVLFSKRKWDAKDVTAVGVVFGMHFLALLAPFQFSWGALWVFVALYMVTGLFGITLSYHRNLSHRSFKLPKALEYLFAYCGVLALQGSPIDWVSVHRYHHQFSDSDKDPHSPLGGFWYSHMGWIFDTKSVMEKCGGTSNAGFLSSMFVTKSMMEKCGGTLDAIARDLEKQPFYRFIQSTYILHLIALGFLLYVLGGLPFVVWGMGVRTVWVYHITWLVNSACHVWGKRAWNTGDLSRNNWWVAVLAFGEGWHNNHHAFEHSARHGLEWWQLDMTWYVVRLLQALQLASNVKLPSEVQKRRMAFNNGSIRVDR